jgi:Skp family chaperone for outer membrane proteins
MMKNVSNRSGLFQSPRVGFAAAALSLSMLAGFSLRSVTATPASLAPAAPVVGMVDLERLVNGLNELKDRNGLIAQKAEGWENEVKSLQTQLNKVENDIKEMPQGPTNRDAKAKLLEKRIELKGSFDAKSALYRELLGMEQGAVIRDLYLKVSIAAKEYSETNGFDLIMIDDRIIELPEGGTNQQYNEIIRSKRVLFSKSTLDITEALMTKMNNQHAAGGSAAPAPASTATPPTPK